MITATSDPIRKYVPLHTIFMLVEKIISKDDFKEIEQFIRKFDWEPGKSNIDWEPGRSNNRRRIGLIGFKILK